MQIRHTAILKKGGGLAAGETSAYQQTSTLFLCSINFYRNEIPNFGSLRVELFEMANSRNNLWTPKYPVRECVMCRAIDSFWLRASNGKRWLKQKRELFLFNNILKYGSVKYGILIPIHLKLRILKLHHNSPLAGHREFESTLYSVQFRYYWNYMPSEIFFRSCHKCQMLNHSNL